MNLRQIAAFVGVYEEGSFSKAAKRLNLTQSGLSMQVQNLEAVSGVQLFERSPRGIVPTFAGQRLYARAVEILRQLDGARTELKTLSAGVSGTLRVGLMPTFTRGVLAPALVGFVQDYPNVTVRVVEAYSAVLTEAVASGELDFAVVPRAPHRDGLRTRHLGTDREVLVRRPGSASQHLQPVSLKEMGPLRLVLPAKGNARRDAFDDYAEMHGLDIEAIIEMDAMIATLGFVANSGWSTILPATICLNDLGGTVRTLHPLADPVLTVDYVLIEPAKSVMTPVAALFLERLERNYQEISRQLGEVLGTASR
jgi:LysR family nitrogen assimilation transcriptional regulator